MYDHWFLIEIIPEIDQNGTRTPYSYSKTISKNEVSEIVTLYVY